MLQVDHVYEFFFRTLFKEFDLYHPNNGVVQVEDINFQSISLFTSSATTTKKIFFIDQEPLVDGIIDQYLTMFSFPHGYELEQIGDMCLNNCLPFGLPSPSRNIVEYHKTNLDALYKKLVIVTSEYSPTANYYTKKYNSSQLYYFFHGFAALDWYRGFYALNFNKQVIKDYTYDYITFNRLVSNDRSYRCYFVSKLAEELLLEHGQISFGLDTEQAGWQEEIIDPETKLSKKAVKHIQLHLPSTPLIIDSEHVLGSASADIPRCADDSFWHIVTETVFYYDKLHLTEKIFKPIVMKQPFMLLAAPGNLAYLKSYGFKTFEGIIDESYDSIQDPDARIDAVVAQLVWYCTLSTEEKRSVIEAIAPIVEYNFHHFYGEFRNIIARELLDNCQTLFKELEYNDSNIDYEGILKTLVN